jgi:hypothetical protein
MSVAPVIFVVGPSGVGKDDVCGWVKKEYNFEWIDIDRERHFEAKGIQSEWNRFKRLDAAPLASALRHRVMEGNAIGAVMSLPSDRVITPEMAKAAEIVGMYTLVLWGTQEACKAARIGRDGFVKGTYDQKNRKAFSTYGVREYEANRVQVFGPDNKHLPRPEVRRLIKAHLALCCESPDFRCWSKINF